MKKDNNVISNLYRAIHEVDYFAVDIKDFDEDRFFSLNEDFANLGALDVYSYILESFKQVKHNAPTDDGEEDVYEVVLHNGQLFTLHLNYAEPRQAKDYIKRKALNAVYKNQNTLAQNYNNILQDLKPEETICVIMFRDEQGKFEQTGKVGISAKELFITLKNALLDSWSKRDSTNIKAVMMRVSKAEPKRLEFYKLLLKKFLTDYKNTIVDNISEDSNILLVASK
jgi:hypothetical protein